MGWLFRRRRRVRVSGDSMRPTLADGDHAFVDPSRTPTVGDVVLCRHPFKRSVLTIKRLAGYDERGHAILLGDDPHASTDSRTLGNFPPDLLLGTVTSRQPS